jgi:Ca2+-binding RTX toxin-like protein
VAAAAITAGGATPAAASPAGYAYGEVVNYPLVFPADEPAVTGYRSHFWDQRYNGDHHAQDLMADKMTEVYAVASGTVTWIGSTCCSVTITHDDGWKSIYIHLNNDTLGTDDGLGWGIAPGIESGSRVERGQLIGWVGDSGNAETTDPHLHFELKAPDPDSGSGYWSGVYVDSFASLKEAEAARGFTCAGEKATRVDTDGDRTISGTRFDDVIVGTAEADTIFAGAGDDLVCGDGGDDHLEGGPGADRLLGGDGDDFLAGGGDGAADILLGGPGDDDLTGSGGDDLLDGDEGDDRLRGGPGDDTLLGGPGRDLLVASPGTDYLDGGRGRDTVTFSAAADPVTADLAAGTAAGGATAALVGLEVARGSSHDDTLTGDAKRNTLLGLGGADTLAGAAGNDRLLGGAGDDTLLGGEGDDFLDGGDGEADSADGGEGTDTCLAETPSACEA